MTDSLEASLSPHGRLLVRGTSWPIGGKDEKVVVAFSEGTAPGLLYLATSALGLPVPPALAFARDLGRQYLATLCQTPELEGTSETPAVPCPDHEALAAIAEAAPPMVGLEYLSADVLTEWWTALDTLVRNEIRANKGGAASYLHALNPVWRLVGRVTFHLAEHKRDPDHPFAFLATYTSGVSAHGAAQHLPLGRALQEYAGANNRPALLSLLTPIQRAAEQSEWTRQLVESGDIYQPLAWTPAQAYQFLQSIPLWETSGLIVRVPDWWNAANRARPAVRVQVDRAAKARGVLGAKSIMDFSVNVALDGHALSEDEIRTILNSAGGLVRLKGQWVEVDRARLTEALQQWKRVEKAAKSEGLSFFEGMRLLAGTSLVDDVSAAVSDDTRAWSAVTAGPALETTLRTLRDPTTLADTPPPDLTGTLRPYQRTGVSWLRFMTTLGLGACLADDMGLGKTIQVIALLLHRRALRGEEVTRTSVLVVPASLIANWQAELAHFAPSLSVAVAHPSEGPCQDASVAAGRDLVITTYSMVSRLSWLASQHWDLVILDEAQAIKNAGTRTARGVKILAGAGRVALTGTPIENSLADLWSLFDFLNPGLLGNAKAFAKATQGHAFTYGALRALVRPYILRRLKTDQRIITDLPEKTEVPVYCGLTKTQATLYQHAVRDLAESLERATGIQRRGIVLATLMRLKQICNHPAQYTGTGAYDEDQSAKFQRLRELCTELAERQDKVLVFTQFREITDPLVALLSNVFGRSGLVLHGGTPVAARRDLVRAFQEEDGPPFFVLSLKAGGTGLNLTAASHVIHFDRWWNPAVENQATDRAFRIGQRRNVMVHKFVCRGTVEAQIDELIASKTGLARDVLDSGAEAALTEMDDKQLLQFVALDIHKALSG